MYMKICFCRGHWYQTHGTYIYIYVYIYRYIEIYTYVNKHSILLGFVHFVHWLLMVIVITFPIWPRQGTPKNPFAWMLSVWTSCLLKVVLGLQNLQISTESSRFRQQKPSIRIKLDQYDPFRPCTSPRASHMLQTPNKKRIVCLTLVLSIYIIHNNPQLVVIWSIWSSCFVLFCTGLRYLNNIQAW